MKELEKMMISAVLSNADHPEYGVATIPFPIPKEHYDQCMELVKALKIGDPFKKDCKVMSVDSDLTVLKNSENVCSMWPTKCISEAVLKYRM